MKILKQVEEWAMRYDSMLNAFDPRFNNMVIVHGLDEMSHFVFDNAFAIMLKEQEYYVVFAEHHSPVSFHKDEYAVKTVAPQIIKEVTI